MCIWFRHANSMCQSLLRFENCLFALTSVVPSAMILKKPPAWSSLTISVFCMSPQIIFDNIFKTIWACCIVLRCSHYQAAVCGEESLLFVGLCCCESNFKLSFPLFFLLFRVCLYSLDLCHLWFISMCAVSCNKYCQ